MGKWIRRIVMVLLLAVFVGSGVMILTTMRQYRVSADLYDDAISTYTTPQENGGDGNAELPWEESSPASDGTSLVVQHGEDDSSASQPRPDAILAPFVVDFDALKKAGPDVVGWIYCPGTIINYPVVQGKNDDYYLHKSYTGAYNFPGSIFVEAINRPGFADSNTIIYGHNMRDNSMFAKLSSWSSQKFYDEHPYIWLMTPEQDYAIVLFSGYTTSAGSETYQVFSDPSEELNAYIRGALEKSDFKAPVEIPADARYVLLSTCAYVFDNARYVLHGYLFPVDSAGGVPLP